MIRLVVLGLSACIYCSLGHAFTKSIQNQIKTLDKRHGVKFNYKRRTRSFGKRIHGGRILRKTLSSSDAPRLKLMLNMIQEEFEKYPENFFNTFRIKEITLVKGLAVKSDIFQKKVHNRYLVPDVMSRGSRLYISIYESDFCEFEDCKDSSKLVKEDYIRDTLHHEIFHLMDPVLNKAYPRDSIWEEFNIEHSYNCETKTLSDFSSTSGESVSVGERIVSDRVGLKINPEDCEKAQDEHYHGKVSSIPGFLTAYSTTAVEEDKAELFMFLMNKEKFETLIFKIYDDEIIYNKAKYLMDSIFEKFPKFSWRHLELTHGRL